MRPLTKERNTRSMAHLSSSGRDSSRTAAIKPKRSALVIRRDSATEARISEIARATKPKGHALSKDEIADLMAVCKEKRFIRPIDIQDAVLLAILRGTGVRWEELVNFDLKDLDISTGGFGSSPKKRQQPPTRLLAFICNSCS